MRYTMRPTANIAMVMLPLIGCSSAELYNNLPEPDRSEMVLIYGGPYDKYVPICDEPGGGRLLWEGWLKSGDDSALDECEPCECTPTKCVLSSEVIANGTLCPGDTVAGAINAGSSWDGTCAARPSPIRSDRYDSVTFYPPTMTECKPVSPVPAPSRKGLTFARACTPGKDFLPSTFRQCYPPQENGECWRGHEARFQFTLHTDTRTCTPCSCGAPTGGKCSAKTTLYSDADCSSEIDSVVVSDKDPPICTTAIRGDIAAMRSGFTENEPGTCAPSNPKIESGKLEAGEKHVFCCAF